MCAAIATCRHHGEPLNRRISVQPAFLPSFPRAFPATPPDTRSPLSQHAPSPRVLVSTTKVKVRSHATQTAASYTACADCRCGPVGRSRAAALYVYGLRAGFECPARPCLRSRPESIRGRGRYRREQPDRFGDVPSGTRACSAYSGGITAGFPDQPQSHSDNSCLGISVSARRARRLDGGGGRQVSSTALCTRSSRPAVASTAIPARRTASPKSTATPASGR